MFLFLIKMAINITINLNEDFNYLGIKDIFTSGKVPNNDIAKLCIT